MSVDTLLLTCALLFGFYVAWNIGANDVANAMGTSVGSGALTLGRAVLLAAILEFGGTLLLGSHVSETVESGIIHPSLFADRPAIYAIGMLSSLLAAGVWLQVASYFGWPVSTTHSIVGAIVGFGVVAVGLEAVYWGQLLFIIISWILSPLLGGAVAFLTFSAIRRRVFYQPDPERAARQLGPWLIALMILMLALVLLLQGGHATLLPLPLWMGFLISVAAALIAGSIGWTLFRYSSLFSFNGTPSIQENLVERRIRRLYHDLGEDQRRVEKIFASLQILSACCMAFAHGANDVANAIGPLSAVISVVRTGTIALQSTISFPVLLLGGVGIVIGLATWGWRVIRTVGKKITELTPTRGFSAEFGASLTILVASRLGLPISTTHTLVGAVLGVGLARGIAAINLKVIRNIIISWVITIPAGALLSVAFFKLFSYLLLLW